LDSLAASDLQAETHGAMASTVHGAPAGGLIKVGDAAAVAGEGWIAPFMLAHVSLT